jgi:hypothetical protein
MPGAIRVDGLLAPVHLQSLLTARFFWGYQPKWMLAVAYSGTHKWSNSPLFAIGLIGSAVLALYKLVKICDRGLHAVSSAPYLRQPDAHARRRKTWLVSPRRSISRP